MNPGWHEEVNPDGTINIVDDVPDGFSKFLEQQAAAAEAEWQTFKTGPFGKLLEETFAHFDQLGP